MSEVNIDIIVARNIRAIMERKCLSAAEVARRAGLNYTGVYDVLSGKSRSPKIETLNKIAIALEVPIAVLLEESTDSNNHREIVALVAQLPPQDRERLIATIRAWLGLSASAQ